MKFLTSSYLIMVLTLFYLAISCNDNKQEKLSSTESVKHVVDSIANEDGVALWNSLPKSYQSDINSLMHLMGEKMSPQMWDDSFTLLNRTGKVLQTKKALFVEMMQANLPAGMNKKQMEEALQNFGEILTTVATSEMAKVEKLKTIDMKQVAETSGNKILNLILNNELFNHSLSQAPEINAKNLKEALAKVKVELVSESGNTATVNVTGPDGVVKINELVKVEDKWIAMQMAASFKYEIANARQELENMSNNAASVATVQMMVHGFLTSLENAKTVDDVKKSLSSLNLNPALLLSAVTMFSPTINQNTAPPISKKKIDKEIFEELRTIGVSMSNYFSSNNIKVFPSGTENYKLNPKIDLSKYAFLSQKGDKFTGSSKVAMVAENPDSQSDKIAVLFQDGHVQFIKGKYYTLDELKETLIRQGFSYKAE